MKRPAALLLLLPMLVPCARAEEMNQNRTAYLGGSVGQVFTGSLTVPTFFPMAELKAGYRVSELFSTQLDLTCAYARISGSAMPSLNGANLLASSLLLGLLFTPALGQTVHLQVGGLIGVQLTSLWGDNLLGTTSGSVSKYLERSSMSYGGVGGIWWDVSDHWSLSAEVRFSAAMADIGGTSFNCGGLGIILGAFYRMKPANN